MPVPVDVPVWKQAPFIRLLIPLIIGILLQWYLANERAWAIAAWCCLLIILIAAQFLSIAYRFRLAVYYGVLLNLFFMLSGASITYLQHGPNQSAWIGQHYRSNQTILAFLREPVSEKPRSFKTVASVVLMDSQQWRMVEGSILIYFEKDSTSALPSYGDGIIFSKPLQVIRNSGNPGAFDYQRYCSFQHIYYQVYLKKNEWIKSKTPSKNPFRNFLYKTRDRVVSLLKRYIPGEKEAGLAEALLIGFKDDLDRDLVQAYSNTGVVHVIAISGLHLGLIYWLLNFLLRPLQQKHARWMRPIFIISCLWIFALLTGASPSVLRSAMMFTCIVLGENVKRKISIYNSLAASAFLLLCYQPFWLWDVGFQLSYIAVLSIVMFSTPVYNLLFISSKWIDLVWKMVSVTISAQILTTPITIYYFHQFPASFIISNLVAIPVSSLILLGEIALCLLAFMPAIAAPLGWALKLFIAFLNNSIEFIDQLPFSSITELYIDIPQTICIYIATACLCRWLITKAPRPLMLGLSFCFSLVLLMAIAKWNTSRQIKMIVYNVPGHTAIDFIDGRSYRFISDSALAGNSSLRQFHLLPSRLIHRIKNDGTESPLQKTGTFLSFHSRVIFIPGPRISPFSSRPRADVAIISKHTRLSVAELEKAAYFNKLVIDSSVPLYRCKKLAEECRLAGLDCHIVLTDGAFEMKWR